MTTMYGTHHVGASQNFAYRNVMQEEAHNTGTGKENRFVRVAFVPNYNKSQAPGEGSGHASNGQSAEHGGKRVRKKNWFTGLVGSAVKFGLGMTVGLVKSVAGFDDEGNWSPVQMFTNIGMMAASVAAIALTGGYAAVPLAVAGFAMCGYGLAKETVGFAGAVGQAMETGDWRICDQYAYRGGRALSGVVLSAWGIRGGLTTLGARVNNPAVGIKYPGYANPAELSMFSFKQNLLFAGVRESFRGAGHGFANLRGNLYNGWSMLWRPGVRLSSARAFGKASCDAALKDGVADSVADDIAMANGKVFTSMSQKAGVAEASYETALANHTRAARTRARMNTKRWALQDKLNEAEAAMRAEFNPTTQRQVIRLRGAVRKAEKLLTQRTRAAKKAREAFLKAEKAHKKWQSRLKEVTEQAERNVDGELAAAREAHQQTFRHLPDEFAAIEENAALVSRLRGLYKDLEVAKQDCFKAKLQYAKATTQAERQNALANYKSALRHIRGKDGLMEEGILAELAEGHNTLMDGLARFERIGTSAADDMAVAFSESMDAAIKEGSQAIGSDASMLAMRGGGVVNPFGNGPMGGPPALNRVRLWTNKWAGGRPDSWRVNRFFGAPFRGMGYTAYRTFSGNRMGTLGATLSWPPGINVLSDDSGMSFGAEAHGEQGLLYGNEAENGGFMGHDGAFMGMDGIDPSITGAGGYGMALDADLIYG